MAVDAGEKMAVQMEPSKKEGAKGSQVLPSGKQLRARKAFQFGRCAELIKAEEGSD